MASHASNGTLDPSELGTKAYWDNIYDRELRNNADDEEDEGTIWFSESNAEATVIRQLDKLAEAGMIRRRDEGEAKASRFLDLGTGNGHMLFQLMEPDDDDDEAEPWEGEMVGVDYSEASVELARRIAAQKGSGDGLRQLSFECWDLLESTPGDWLGGGFDVVLDKGTFDAISLMDHSGGRMHPCDVYRDKVPALIKPDCFLVITSCNWTKDELERWLSVPQGSELVFFGEAKYPTFTFGGKTGQSIVTLAFQRKGG